MPLQSGTAGGLVGISESELLLELQNGKVWQLPSEAQYCDFYLYERALPGTWGASIQHQLQSVKNTGG